jgi:uncharacterized RDD family membrane protein YckC
MLDPYGGDPHAAQPVQPGPAAVGAPPYPQPQAQWGQVPGQAQWGQVPGQPHHQPAAAMPGTPASIAARFFARLIDGVITSIVYVGASVPVAFAANGRDPSQGPGPAALVLLGVAMLAVLLYEFVLTGMYGATLGKRAMKLRVVTVSGGRAGWGACALRAYIPTLAGAATCGLGGLLFSISPLFDSGPWSRGWADQIARTAVVRVG